MARRTAYLDESIRLGAETVYVVAAVIVDEPAAAAMRPTLRAIVGPGRPPFHWRSEDGPVRQDFLAVLSGCDGAFAAFVHRGATPQERARRKCLERMLWELRDVVDTVVIESRGVRGDGRDVRTIRQAHARRLVDRPPSYDFAHPETEPLLWAADAVAGAVRTQLCDGSPAYADFVSLVTVHGVGP